jgi:hypothetical protein
MLVLALAGSVQGADDLRDPHRQHGAPALLGSLSCAASACHGRVGNRREPTTQPGGEFVRWSLDDPHSRAAQLLTSPRFAQILARYVDPDSNDDNERRRRTGLCAACHDPMGIATTVFGESATVGISAEPLTDGSVSNGPITAHRGIGCESCHGPSRDWIGHHAEPGISRSTLAALGMTPTKSLAERAVVCSSCHVGSATQDMNHDMIAAGHPELIFELASFMRRLPKHWNDRQERSRVTEFESRVWLAGQWSSLQAALRTCEGRADRASSSSDAQPWPESAEYDCLACHQPLQAAAATVPIHHRKTTILQPVLQRSRWPYAFADLVLDPSDTDSRGRLDRLLAPVASGFASPQATATELRALLAQVPVRPDAITCTDSPTRVILEAVRSHANNASTWDEFCQLVLALSAVERAYYDELQLVFPGGNDEATNRTREVQADRRQLELIRNGLAFAPNGRIPRWMLTGQGPTDHDRDSDRTAFPSPRLPDMLNELARNWQLRWDSLPGRAAPGNGATK